MLITKMLRYPVSIALLKTPVEVMKCCSLNIRRCEKSSRLLFSMKKISYLTRRKPDFCNNQIEEGFLLSIMKSFTLQALFLIAVE